jgi:hypothetical protein
LFKTQVGEQKGTVFLKELYFFSLLICFHGASEINKTISPPKNDTAATQPCYIMAYSFIPGQRFCA